MYQGGANTENGGCQVCGSQQLKPAVATEWEEKLGNALRDETGS